MHSSVILGKFISSKDIIKVTIDYFNQLKALVA
jgi:hypothetical protein